MECAQEILKKKQINYMWNHSEKWEAKFFFLSLSSSLSFVLFCFVCVSLEFCLFLFCFCFVFCFSCPLLCLLVWGFHTLQPLFKSSVLCNFLCSYQFAVVWVYCDENCMLIVSLKKSHEKKDNEWWWAALILSVILSLICRTLSVFIETGLLVWTLGNIYL